MSYAVPWDVIVDNVIRYVVPTVLASILTYMVAKTKEASKSSRAMEKGMRSILRRELKIMHRHHVIKGEPISIDDKDEATEIYTAYHDLGGNGTGTHMYHDIMELPITR